jgi:hypothetical protein
MGGLDRAGGENCVFVWKHRANGKRGETIEEVRGSLVAVSFGNTSPTFIQLMSRCSSASWRNDSTAGAAAWSSTQAMMAHASTTLDSVIVSGDFSGAVGGQITEEVSAPEHVAHGAPVGMIPNQPFQDHRLTLNVDRNFGSSFEVEPLPHRLGNGDLPFRRNGGLSHAALFYQGKRDCRSVQVDSYGGKTAEVRAARNL